MKKKIAVGVVTGAGVALVALAAFIGGGILYLLSDPFDYEVPEEWDLLEEE